MGKRVDFSARTVITPDPNLRIDQVNYSDTFFCQYFRFLFTVEKDILLRLR
jgi:DNA-directed RNA polymerase beta' subunit